MTLLGCTRTGGVLSWQKLIARWSLQECHRYLELSRESDISQARSALASLWLQKTADFPRDGGEWCLWIDDDIGVDFDDLVRFVENAMATDLDLVAGVYVGKRSEGRTVTCRFQGHGDSVVRWGKTGGYYPIIGCGFGCVLVRRRVFEWLASSLPLVYYPQTSSLGRPYFLGLVAPQEADPLGPGIHLGEDYAFCLRAARVGAGMSADTRLRLWHEGPYQYGLEDADSSVSRVESLEIHVGKAAKTGPSEAELKEKLEAIGRQRLWERRS